MVDVTRLPKGAFRLCADPGTGRAPGVHLAARGDIWRWAGMRQHPDAGPVHGRGRGIPDAKQGSNHGPSNDRDALNQNGAAARARAAARACLASGLSGQPARGASGGSISAGRKEQGYPRGAVAALCPDGRLHLQHGPIDIVAEAFGEPVPRYGRAMAGRRRGLRRCWRNWWPSFPRCGPSRRVAVDGAIARRMAAAVAPFRPAFITPMAAVAGRWRRRCWARMSGPGITRAYANNGGDIALWLAPGKA